MLIVNSKLDIEAFKVLFEKLSWIHAPRILGVNHREFFYFGELQEADRKITVQVRPSKRMQVFETFHGRTHKGEVPPEGYSGALCDWGSSVEVRIDEALFNKVKEISKPKPDREIQTVTW